MIDPDDLKFEEIQCKLRSKEFIPVKNSKSTHELWISDISLIALIDDDGNERVLKEWCACKHSLAVYRTHSKKNMSENQKNYGLTSLNAHMKEFSASSKKISSSIFSDAIPKESATVQSLIPSFVYDKAQLTDHSQIHLKDAELRFEIFLPISKCIIDQV